MARQLIRTRIDTVVLRSPFTLPGLERTYPAGTYDVATDEEQLDVSFTAFRRVETRIRLPSGAEAIYWPITPTDLERILGESMKGHPA